MTPGRDLDVAVARVLGLNVRPVAGEPNGPLYVWSKENERWEPWCWDDATALAHCVPWLEQQGGYALEITIRGLSHSRVFAYVWDQHNLPLGKGDGASIAEALAHVVCAVAGEVGNG